MNGDVLSYLRDFLLSNDHVFYELAAFSIMPNHVHLLLKPNEQLAMLMQKIKGPSSRFINQMLSRKGKFWSADYYDKAIRNEKHFSVVYKYIKQNPLTLIGSEVLTSENEKCGAKAPLPRFYGIYEH